MMDNFRIIKLATYDGLNSKNRKKPVSCGEIYGAVFHYKYVQAYESMVGGGVKILLLYFCTKK